MRNIREEIIQELQLIIDDLDGFVGDFTVEEGHYSFKFVHEDGTPYFIVALSDEYYLDLAMALPIALVSKIIKYWGDEDK